MPQRRRATCATCPAICRARTHGCQVSTASSPRGCSAVLKCGRARRPPPIAPHARDDKSGFCRCFGAGQSVIRRGPRRFLQPDESREWPSISRPSAALSSPFPTRPASSNSAGRWRRAGSSSSRPGAPPRRWPRPASRSWTSPELTGFPEMMDGRLKTLHPRIHGGLLAIRAEPAHQAAMIANGIAPIDLLVVNLYPFEDALRSRRAVRGDDREHRHRRAGDDPRRRQEPRRRRRDRRRRGLRGPARRDGRQRRRDAARLPPRAGRRRPSRAPPLTTRRSPTGWRARSSETAPAWRAFGGRLGRAHCAMARTRTSAPPSTPAPRSRPGVATARQLQGKELSYNNINDTDAAYELVAEFDPGESAAAAIIKHANPCGVAVGASLARSLREGAGLRSGLGLRRHRRAQPRARRGGGAQDRRDLHRGHHRAGGRRRGAGDRRDEEEPAPADRRRPARSARADRWRALGRRRPAGAGPRRRRARSPRRSRSSPSARRARPSSPISRSPGGCASTSSRTRCAGPHARDRRCGRWADSIHRGLRSVNGSGVDNRYRAASCSTT